MYILKKRVRFYETDGMSVVYHGNYLKWFEEARVEYMREGGVCLNDLLNEGIVFPVVEIHVKYLKSARYDDIVLVKTYLREA
ncbi:MAG: thioesterase family protein, partial [Dialister sp.]|nr:thioesterase family protein [Dialister sp.]